jgi:hypothetical protein
MSDLLDGSSLNDRIDSISQAAGVLSFLCLPSCYNSLFSVA